MTCHATVGAQFCTVPTHHCSYNMILIILLEDLVICKLAQIVQLLFLGATSSVIFNIIITSFKLCIEWDQKVKSEDTE